MGIASNVKRWALALLAAASLLAATGAGAGTPLPEVPKALKGDQCVEDTSVMRREHMDFLMHQRDDTLRRGIRTTDHSLKQCLGCHVPPASQKKVEFGTPEHFCSSCHSYAAVKIDCFTCHAEQPSE